MDIKEQIKKDLTAVLSGIGFKEKITVEVPKDISKGDYTTNVAFIAAKELKKSPQEIASKICSRLREKEYLRKVETVGGFINFYISLDFLSASLSDLLTSGKKTDNSVFDGQKIMVEYAHPNTHKEMHIGHMRTLVTGEAISRLLESQNADVFRANYQGDIGPHVAKAIYGIQKIMAEKNLKLEVVEKWSSKDKVHFLGQGYVVGGQDYEEHKQEIDDINEKLYSKSEDIKVIYEQTRKWSLDYYDEFYTRFYTHFDQLFFESEMAQVGKQTVLDNTPKVFLLDQGAYIFPGDKYGLHRRVFITKDGNPTYEGKELGNAQAQYKAFKFDRKIHVVASEQKGYFEVVFKALDLIDPEKFEGKQLHISMGMVQLSDRKMSSRTGDVLTVDWLIDQVKEKVMQMLKEGRIKADDKEKVSEQISIGAIKYSILKVGTGQDVSFDIEKSVSLEGDSGPYLQYTIARINSILAKSKVSPTDLNQGSKFKLDNLEVEEENLLRLIYRYPEIKQQAAEKLLPNILSNYLFDVAQSFNLFYQKHKILGSEQEHLRIFVALITSRVLKLGLELLGIESPEQM
ncbi:arginine--tRNA ligase [Patescibacteria group bacterium]|nr:arginine--tRNA ligase [Patescibacteria group bacterium]